MSKKLEVFGREDPPPYEEVQQGRQRPTAPLRQVLYDDQSEDEEYVVQGVSSTKVELYSSTKEERTFFLRKVFAILLGQSVVIAGMMAFTLFVPQIHENIGSMEFWKFWTVWVISALLVPCITTFDRKLRKPPMNLAFLALATFPLGILLATISSRLETDRPLIVVGIIGIIYLAVVLFTLQHKFHFTPLISTCYVWTLLLVAFGLLCSVYSVETSGTVIAFPTIFLTYLVVAAQQLIKDDEVLLMSDEGIYSAARILMYLFHLMDKTYRKICIRACPCCYCCCCMHL